MTRAVVKYEDSNFYWRGSGEEWFWRSREDLVKLRALFQGFTANDLIWPHETEWADQINAVLAQQDADPCSWSPGKEEEDDREHV